MPQAVAQRMREQLQLSIEERRQLPTWTDALRQFRDERNWAQFHTLRNLIVSLNLEASELLELTSQAREHSRHITAVTEQMHNLTQEGVMAMQFEDIVTQMMDRINQRANNVGEYMHAFLALHQDNEADGLQRFRHRSQKLVQLLVNSHVKSDALQSSNAASHAKDSSNGEIELF